MSDPLSTVGSIVALLGAFAKIASQATEFIVAYKDAPTELILLANEINDITVVLDLIRTHLPTLCAQHDSNTNPEAPRISGHAALSLYLRLVSNKAIELDVFIQSITAISVNHGPYSVDIDKLGWAFKKKKEATKLREQLKNLKEKLHGLLNVRTILILWLSGLRLSVDRIEAVLERIMSTSNDERTRHGEKLESIVEKLDLCTSQLSSRQLAVNANQTRSTIHETLPCAGHTSQANRSPDSSNTPIFLQMQRSSSRECEGECDCICHLRSRSWWRSPIILQNVLGFYFLTCSGILGLSLMKPACTSAKCESFSTCDLMVTYCLPKWLMMKAAHFAIRKSEYGEPQAALFIQRRTAEFAFNSIYHRAQEGDVLGLEKVLVSHEAMPNDAADTNGYTALHFAVEAGKIDAARFLIQNGAKLHLGDNWGITPVQSAWQLILLQSLNEPKRERLRDLFPEASSVRAFHFSDIHKAVLKIFPGPLNLRLLVLKWRDQVNFTDAWGRTPLHWAAYKGDTAAIETLLLAGAEVNARDQSQKASIHYAAYNSSDTPLQLLLAANANPLIEDEEGLTALHCASYNSITHVQLLVNSGCPINVTNNRGAIPLAWAAAANKVDIGEYLIAYSADMNDKDKLFGNPIIFTAISSGADQFLEMLLDRHADVTPVNRAGETLLHCVARYGRNTRVFDILNTRIQQVSVLDVDCKDSSGKTAQEVLRGRISAPDGFDSRFEALLGRILEQQRNSGARGSFHIDPKIRRAKENTNSYSLIWLQMAVRIGMRALLLFFFVIVIPKRLGGLHLST